MPLPSALVDSNGIFALLIQGDSQL